MLQATLLFSSSKTPKPKTVTKAVSKKKKIIHNFFNYKSAKLKMIRSRIKKANQSNKSDYKQISKCVDKKMRFWEDTCYFLKQTADIKMGEKKFYLLFYIY